MEQDPSPEPTPPVQPGPRAPEPPAPGSLITFLTLLSSLMIPERPGNREQAAGPGDNNVPQD